MRCQFTHYCFSAIKEVNNVFVYILHSSVTRHRENLLLSNRNSAAAQNLIWFFLLFENFLRKLLNLLISKQKKICSSTKNYRIMNHFEFFWAHFSCSISVCQNFQSHFLSFYGQTGLFWLFCYENQSIKKTFFHSVQSAVNGKFCQFCCFRLAEDFRGVSV